MCPRSSIFWAPARRGGRCIRGTTPTFTPTGAPPSMARPCWRKACFRRRPCCNRRGGAFSTPANSKAPAAGRASRGGFWFCYGCCAARRAASFWASCCLARARSCSHSRGKMSVSSGSGQVPPAQGLQNGRQLPVKALLHHARRVGRPPPCRAEYRAPPRCARQ